VTVARADKWRIAVASVSTITLFATFLSTTTAWRAQTSAPARPKVLGVAHVALRVSNLSTARHFYHGLLGYDEVTSGAASSTAVFVVNERQRLIVHSGLLPEQDERLLHLAFETESLDGMRSYLASRALTAGEAVADDFGAGRAFDVTDPDDHRVRFIQRDQRHASALPRSPKSEDRRIARRLLHAGLTVRDAAAADRFYKDAFGFSEIWRGGRTDAVTSWINMRVPDGTDYLEYMLISGPVDKKQLGTLHHVALLVPDIQEALELVRARADARNAQATPQIGRNRRWQLNLYDPDGTRVELMEPWTVR
jgi:catechol 2,3-dioxygenase-like lactoylglutathione lyase family enzyme